jgi:hypothetical protein
MANEEKAKKYHLDREVIDGNRWLQEMETERKNAKKEKNRRIKAAEKVVKPPAKRQRTR